MQRSAQIGLDGVNIGGLALFHLVSVGCDLGIAEVEKCSQLEGK